MRTRFAPTNVAGALRSAAQPPAKVPMAVAAPYANRKMLIRPPEMPVTFWR